MSPSPPARRRDGFTIVELLVVTAVIALLMGLLLPAIQQVREAANRASCGNNLHQMAIAMHLYNNDKGYLPPRCVLDNGATWAVLILPYMEQENLFVHWDLSLSYYDQSDLARQTFLKNYFCPSRRSAEGSGSSISGDQQWLSGNNYGPLVPGALGDYAACLGAAAFT
jgi:prepilin-type N-terminal cleavage/methylation domain-containing protein